MLSLVATLALVGDVKSFVSPHLLNVHDEPNYDANAYQLYVPLHIKIRMVDLNL